jgi:oligopeptide/dipeptide ABC transporter ATP-binding protein
VSLLEIEALRVEFPGADGPLAAVKGVDLALEAGEVVGLVGESGSGKSLTCRAVMRMIPEPGSIAGGSVRFDGSDVLGLSTAKLRDLRADSIGMIYQNPFGSLNPTQRVGAQIAETLKVNRGIGRDAAKKEALALLDRVAVMYGGHIVETGPVETIYHEPEHPYTKALLNSVPELDSAGNVRRRAALAGHPPELSDVIPGCVFAPRCEHARPGCESISMKLEKVGPAHDSACPVRPFAKANSAAERVEA